MRCRSKTFALLCTVLAVFAAPALAETAAAPAALFAEPACAFTGAAAPAALGDLPTTAPAPLWMTGCNADLTCPADYVIGCTGNNTCVVGADYVECDGVRTSCPTCEIPYPACHAYPAEYCACVNGGGAPTACRRCICLGLC